MLVLIVKDGATKVPKEVASVAEAEAYRAQGFEIEWPDGDPTAPAPEAEPVPAALVAPVAPKAGKTKAGKG